jgi:ADP-ribosyl-[dinitrogen reductase] hydrolase
MYLSERYRGALLGLAAGDALGTTVEFKQRGTFSQVTEIVGGGVFDLAPGQWTDDTSMALCLADSLIQTGTFEPRDHLHRYVRWRDEGYMSSNGRCFDIGNTVHAALARFERTNEPYCGSVDPFSAGNGSLMRLAPVPLRWARNAKEAIEKSGESSRTTHGAATAVDACRYFGGLLLGALREINKEELLSPCYAPIPGYWDSSPLSPEIREVASGSYKRKQPPTIESTGYVVKTLEAALWAFHSSQSFENGCRLAVNLGGDADTCGAVYGQLAGAFYGEKAIPERWREILAHRPLIESLADSIYALSAED